MRWLVVTLALVVVETTAAAAPCTTEAVAAEVTALGGPSLTDIAAHVELDGRIGSVTYVMASGEVVGPRVVEAASCGELAKSLALVIVMSWRADDPAPRPGLAPAPRPALAPAPRPALATSTPPVDVPRPGDVLRPADVPTISDERIETPPLAVANGSVRADRHVAVLLGAATAVNDQPALVLGARWRRGRFSLGGELYASAPLAIDVGDGGSVTVTRYSIDAAPCFHVSRLALCGLASAGMIGGEGHNLAHAASVRRAAILTGARVEASYPLGRRLALRVHVDGLQALTSSRFSVDEMVVWTSNPRELWLGGGILAVFP